jgi:hypothetical protein
MPDGFIAGRGKEKARTLLGLASELGFPVDVIRATNGGYYVPEEVVDAFNGEPSVPPVGQPEPVAPAGVPAAGVVEYPNGGASKAEWLAFAATLPNWEPADAELKRDELKAKYGPESE